MVARPVAAAGPPAGATPASGRERLAAVIWSGWLVRSVRRAVVAAVRQVGAPAFGRDGLPGDHRNKLGIGKQGARVSPDPEEMSLTAGVNYGKDAILHEGVKGCRQVGTDCRRGANRSIGATLGFSGLEPLLPKGR